MGCKEMTCDWEPAGVEPWTPGDKTSNYSPTDAALYLAIAHVWLTEGTGHESLRSGTAGFEAFEDYVLGGQDGIPKRPQWAAAITGIPSYTIKALARNWAETSLAEAFPFGSDDDLQELIFESELIQTDLSPRPSAPRSELPSTCISGTVYDYLADEVIEGAVVTLRWSPEDPGVMGSRGTKLTVLTDEFGSFLLNGLKGGTYRISVGKDGYITRELGPITAGDTLRDIAMFPDSRGLLW